jgi:hypothetical protein
MRSGVIGMIIIIVVFFDGGTRRTTAYGEATRDVWGRWRAGHIQWARATADGGANGNGGRNGAMRGIETGLNKVFALGLCDERLEFRGGEGIYEAGFGDNQEEDLCASEGGQLVCLRSNELGDGHLWKKNYLFHNACK